MRATAMVLLVAVGCGGSGAAPDMGPSCPQDLPMACPSPTPMFDGGVADVNALITDKCVTCHRQGGVAASWPLDSYGGVYRLRQEVLSQVYSCLMPPPDAGQLDETQRQALLGWLVCGAPNN